MLDNKAFKIASECVRFLPGQTEKEFIYYLKYFIEDPSQGCTPEEWIVSFIQRQSFAERIHYMWLCLTRNIAITDKHGNVIWSPCDCGTIGKERQVCNSCQGILAKCA